MQITDATRVERVRALNDSFRRTLMGGRVLMTSGIQALGSEQIAGLLMKLRTFDAFDEGNDPHGEHDFGSFEHARERIFWKLDYYDPTLSHGSEDPADPSKTVRVLTIMLAEEY
jgi:hypothetical protein